MEMKFRKYRRALSVCLAAVMIWNLCTSSLQLQAMAGDTGSYLIDDVEELPEDVLYRQVAFGTTYQELELPDRLHVFVRRAGETGSSGATPSGAEKILAGKATPSEAGSGDTEDSGDGDGAWRDVQVRWAVDRSAGEEEYNGERPGIYVFQAQPSSGRYLMGDAVLPSIEVEVLAEESGQRTIKGWQWIDPDGNLEETEEGWVLALPGIDVENPVGRGEIESLLPQAIAAAAEGAGGAEAAGRKNGIRTASGSDADEDISGSTDQKEESITLAGWSCTGYPADGAYEGSYTFTAGLPENFGLDEAAEALEVKVRLGGTVKLGADERTVLDISRGNIEIGDGTVSGKDSDGNDVTEVNANGYIIVGETDSNQIKVTGGSHKITLRGVTIDYGDSNSSSINDFK